MSEDQLISFSPHPPRHLPSFLNKLLVCLFGQGLQVSVTDGPCQTRMITFISSHSVRIYGVTTNSQGVAVSMAMIYQRSLLSLASPAEANTDSFTPILIANSNSMLAHYIQHSKYICVPIVLITILLLRRYTMTKTASNFQRAVTHPVPPCQAGPCPPRPSAKLVCSLLVFSHFVFGDSFAP